MNIYMIDHIYYIYMCIYTHICMFFVVFQLLSYVRLFVTPWTAAHQASLYVCVYIHMCVCVCIYLHCLLYLLTHYITE